MSSIRTVQTERLLEDVVRTLYADGTTPLSSRISELIARYLSKFPAGQPLPLPLSDAISAGTSDVDEYNKLLAHLAINLDVLYETSLRQVEETVDLVNSLSSHLNRLRQQRKRVDNRIDDYLLSMYNTDGYYFAVSDSFADLSLVDLQMTSAEIDTNLGAAVLPTKNSLVTSVPASEIGAPTIQVRNSRGEKVNHDVVGGFSGARQASLDNTAWSFEVRSSDIEEMVATVEFSVGTQEAPIELSRLDITPFGVTPLQVFVEVRNEDAQWQDFGNRIQTSIRKMVFNDLPTPVRKVRLTLRKTAPDYTEELNGSFYSRYIFGAKQIVLSQHLYDQFARVVSKPLFVAEDLEQEVVIDAVSLSVEDNKPPSTDIAYYVAASTGESNEDFSELNWHQLAPVDENSSDLSKTVRFDGADLRTVRIARDPAPGDLQLIPLVNTGVLSQRNPSSSIISGVDTYRIAEFEEDVLLNSLRMYEGVNSTRIYSRNLDPLQGFNNITLDYWGEVISEQFDTLTEDYGDISAGFGFFYGGDVGAVGKDVFVETYLHSDTSYPTFLDEFRKLDERAQTWDVKVYLNGKIIGDLPVGTDTAQMPWNLRRGTNHIVLLARIPLDSPITDAFIGSVALMGSSSLGKYGKVRLAEWDYIDPFHLTYNQTGQPRTFSFINGEIVSRRRPTSNFELQYATRTGSAPAAVRFRADLSRSSSNPQISPQLLSYRLRYSYSTLRGEGSES